LLVDIYLKEKKLKMEKYYWTYISKAGFHVCDYIRLTIAEAIGYYGKSLDCRLSWSKVIV
jgi:hypothetical protein